ncbi:hypothetical protein HANVADRAFT_53921 [Hanseniaspora valbyensis NRRL Y-1626]|uniref:RING-type domain-containing protein n=1 Tax=Hanseniaspora valbyensis NRRL Y-1626 TaxID=766949 RepID=A0A1B7T9N5_9ASCO|nr:hypothetical protein HANVADRAFT_53921 [Hanseniaspora valbyensis NRRL Y-1626]
MSQFNHLDSMLSDDEEDEYCPLCIEALDLSDKHFKPCPCGYQICSFCYNNIRTNPTLNGKCPGCRRLYDDESVEYITLSPEELKLEQTKQAKKEKERKQREKEKREMENNSRKQLASMRVIQKNLVYVIGVNPPPQAINHSTGLVNTSEMVHLLRNEKYFGQYGKVVKLVVNKLSNSINSSYGVYVTYSKKGEAAECISNLDGSFLDGKLVKAAYGTTKYCSSYLRGQTCPNPNCMFLHEPSDEADLFQKTGSIKNSGGYHSKSHHAALPKITPPMRLSAPSNALDSEHKSIPSTTTNTISNSNSNNNATSISQSPPTVTTQQAAITGNGAFQSPDRNATPLQSSSSSNINPWKTQGSTTTTTTSNIVNAKSSTSTPATQTSGLSSAIHGGNPWITKNDDEPSTPLTSSMSTNPILDPSSILPSLLKESNTTNNNNNANGNVVGDNETNSSKVQKHEPHAYDSVGYANVILDNNMDFLQKYENKKAMRLNSKILFSEEEVNSTALDRVPKFLTNLNLFKATNEEEKKLIVSQDKDGIFTSCVNTITIKPDTHVQDYINLENEIQATFQKEQQLGLFQMFENKIHQYLQIQQQQKSILQQQQPIQQQPIQQQVPGGIPVQGPPPGLHQQQHGNNNNTTDLLNQLFKGKQQAA